MIGITEKNGILHADDTSLEGLANQYGTPSYIYSAKHIRQQYEALDGAMKRHLPEGRKAHLCYACKANSNIAVLSYLQSLGADLEIVSEGELKRGLKAGFKGEQIISTGVGKQDSEIRACLEAGIKQFNVESISELKHIQEIASSMDKKAPVAFRLNPNVSGGGHHKISTGRKRDKFGISDERVFEGFDLAKDMSHIEMKGISMHIGSQVFDVHVFEEAFKVFASVVNTLRSAGHKVETLDIGGGFPVQYNNEDLLDLDAYAQWVADIIAPLDTEIFLEPGRYLVANAGVLLSRVLYIKKTQDRDFIVLDAAMNDLIRPTLYDAYHGIEPVSNRDRSLKTYDIVGPICETGDTFATAREIPEVSVGDLMVIKSAGAYGLCMASNYNTRGIPAEIFVNGDQHGIIRQRQSFQDIIQYECMPDWLSA